MIFDTHAHYDDEDFDGDRQALLEEMCIRDSTTPVRDQLPLVTASQPAEGAAEVLSLTGEVMKREKMDPALQSVYKDTECPLFVHIHISCAHRDGSVRGGGLAAGNAFRSLRIFMTPLG